LARKAARSSQELFGSVVGLLREGPELEDEDGDTVTVRCQELQESGVEEFSVQKRRIVQVGPGAVTRMGGELLQVISSGILVGI